MTAKSEGAFRTIREVADWLGVPTHVLRFWESKFDLVAPVKGSGGRRYYRPEDMRLLGGIKVLLHDQGQTIRGVSQRIEDEGPDGIMSLSPAFEEADAAASRTRRVIRAGEEEGEGRTVPHARGRLTLVNGGAGPDDGPPRPDSDPSEESDTPAPERRDGDAPPERPAPAVEPGDVAPDREAAPEPGPSDPVPPEPEIPPVDEDRSAPSDYPEEEAAPGDPIEEGQPQPGTVPGDAPAPAEPEPAVDDEPDPSGEDGRDAETPPAAAQTVPPSLEALRRLHRAAPTRPDRRRLRRVLRRLRNLIEEVEEDLENGAA